MAATVMFSGLLVVSASVELDAAGETVTVVSLDVVMVVTFISEAAADVSDGDVIAVAMSTVATTAVVFVVVLLRVEGELTGVSFVIVDNVDIVTVGLVVVCAELVSLPFPDSSAIMKTSVVALRVCGTADPGDSAVVWSDTLYPDALPGGLSSDTLRTRVWSPVLVDRTAWLETVIVSGSVVDSDERETIAMQESSRLKLRRM